MPLDIGILEFVEPIVNRGSAPRYLQAFQRLQSAGAVLEEEHMLKLNGG